MALREHCDVCGKPTTKIAYKLFLSEKNGRSDHSNYTAHADVGECCQVAVKRDIKWQPRKKQERSSSAST